MDTPTVTTAAIYCRISQDRTGAGLGVDRQREDCEKLAESRGWGIAGLYVDNDVSAYSGKRRPEYERLMTDVRDGRVGAILAWHPDRLHRSPLELETFIATVEAAGTRIETVRAGHVDLATPSGRVVARTLGAMARYESEHKSERISRKHEELARAGQPIRGGTRAFGLSADWTTIVDDEADLIREAYRRILDGATVGSIAADWQSRGILSPAGLPWRPGPLRRLLTSARLAALREHRGAIVGAGIWPAIVDRAAWERVRATLDARTPRVGTPRRYLLTGLVRCGACGEALMGRPRADHVRRYVCARGPNFKGCGRTFIVAEPTEAAVVEMVLAVLDGPETEAAIRREAAMLDRTDDADRLAADERGLEDLARDHYVQRIIGRTEYLAARDGLEARIAASRAALAAGGHGRRLAAALTVRGRWEDLTFARRREIVETVLESVAILPGRRGYNRFDVARLAPVWRV
jgi:site-specific DNA recombinase